MDIVPAIDIIDGKCVRLEKGRYDRKKIYDSDPLQVAKRFADHGIKRLHLVDLEGAKSKAVVNWKTIEEISKSTDLKIDFGGGIKSEEDLQKVLDCGAEQVTVGSIAAQSPELFLQWLNKFGRERIILGADLNQGYVASQGWLDQTELHWFDFLDRYLKEGVEYVICTDIAKDGMLAGPAIELYEEILEQFPPIKLIASGGVASMQDVHDLAATGCDACIIGKAIYEDNISLKDLQQFIDAG